MGAVFWFYIASSIKADQYGEISYFLGIAKLFSENQIFTGYHLNHLKIKEINETLKKAKLNRPKDEYMQSGSKNGIHTELLGKILSETPLQTNH